MPKLGGIVPQDVLPLILEHLSDRRDLHRCAQLSKSFNHAATPLLYRTLDARIVKGKENSSKTVILHPCTTLLRRPEYAKYVRHVREQGGLTLQDPALIADTQDALRLCVNLRAFTWSDDGSDNGCENIFLFFLEILETLPLRELKIKSFRGLSDFVWTRVESFTKLTRVAVWCMEGRPRFLQGWSERLGDSLTHLELGRCAGVPASILTAVLSHLPLLQSLLLKGAPSKVIPEILTFLPALVTLDTEYVGGVPSPYEDVPVSALRDLTVRTGSVHLEGPPHLWSWIRRLTPHPSLESFTLHAFSLQDEAQVPRSFLLGMAATHSTTLRMFHAPSTQLSLGDIECVCSVFPQLESLSCTTMRSRDAELYGKAIENARNLRELRLHSGRWMPSTHNLASSHRHEDEDEYIPSEAVVGVARTQILRPGSVIRTASIGPVVCHGQWVLKPSADGGPGVPELEVTTNLAQLLESRKALQGTPAPAPYSAPLR